MAKFKGVLKPKGIQPTSIPGVFARNVPLSVLDGFVGMGEASNAEALAYCFQHILCDENGEQFDDVQTPEAVSAEVTLGDLAQLRAVLTETLGNDGS